MAIVLPESGANSQRPSMGGVCYIPTVQNNSAPSLESIVDSRNHLVFNGCRRTIISYSRPVVSSRHEPQDVSTLNSGDYADCRGHVLIHVNNMPANVSDIVQVRMRFTVDFYYQQ